MKRYRHEGCGGNWEEIPSPAGIGTVLRCVRCGTAAKVKDLGNTEVVPLEAPLDRVRALIAAQKERGGGLVSITALEQAIGDRE